MQRVPRAAVYRLATLALDVLNEAYKQAEDRGIERNAMHRLALGYLLLTGCATVGHTRTVWEVLGHENGFDEMSNRQSHFGVVMDGIKRNIDKRLSAPAASERQNQKV